MTTKSSRPLTKRFCSAEAGLAAVEFALIAPIMIALFLGVVEGSMALSAARKTTLSANTLADLVAQEAEITKDNLDDLFVGMEDIIDSRDIPTTFRVVSVIFDSGTNTMRVHWSYSSNGSVPYAPGSEFTGDIDATLLDDTASLIVAEVEYDYASPISARFVKAVTLDKTATRWPRRAARVQYCVTVGSCTT
jgi:Flp pilus assembly pilin Flp